MSTNSYSGSFGVLKCTHIYVVRLLIHVKDNWITVYVVAVKAQPERALRVSPIAREFGQWLR